MSSWFWDEENTMSDFQQEYVAAFLDGKMPDLMNEIMETAEKFNNDVRKSDIPNTEYITINKDGVFVGGEPAIYYRGKKMHSQSLTQTYFLYIQEKFPVIEEVHVLSSKTEAKLYNINEKPSQQDGKHTWCRVKFTKGKLGYWTPNLTWNNAVETYCYCVADIGWDAEFTKKLFLPKNENER